MGLNVTLDPEDVTAALTRFIGDHVEDSGAEEVVFGLSSGLDSAVIGALAVRALGPDRVHPVFLPSASTPDADREQAQALAEWMGVGLEERNVDSIVEAIVSTVGESDRATVGNAAARARMSVLYALARKRRAIVLGTGNKSELLVGYFTKWGDGGSDLLPIGDLYKTQVRMLAGHLGLPDFVIEKTPSAGLWEGQTDEQELGVSYDLLDAVLLGFEIGLPVEKVAEQAGADLQTVTRIDGMRRTSEHKRNMPRVCKIGIRSLTRDWRRSVTEGGPPEA